MVTFHPKNFLQRHTFWCVGLLLLVCVGAITAIEAFDRHRAEQSFQQDMDRELGLRRDRLQATLDHLVKLNRDFARHVASHPQQTSAELAPLAAAVVAQQPLFASVVITRQLKVVFVHPLRGNEAVVGMDYALHPEFMDSMKRAITTRDTVIDAPIQMMQTGRSGLVVRTPVFGASTDSGDAFQGVVSMAIDLEALLVTAGVLPQTQAFTFAIRQVRGDKIGRHMFGDPGIFQHAHARMPIVLPDIGWEMAVAPILGTTHQATHTGWIRGVGGLATVLLVAVSLWMGQPKRLASPVSPSITPSPIHFRRQFPLRTVLLGTVFVTVPLVSGVSGWLSFKASMQVAQELEQQHVVELANQLRDRVTAFFDVPRRVAAFNAEQFRSGYLTRRRQEDLLRNFLLQLRQQPLLTFVSMGTVDGEYFSASRPPLGRDKALRMMQATKADNFLMKLYRVDDANRRSTLVSTGNTHFDARTRPWFQAAVLANSLRWYPAYRYNIQDDNGLYGAMGMGMAAPLYDTAGQFVGVATADVALSQLNDFLKEQMTGLGGVAFLTEASGELLASSEPEPAYLINGDTTIRLQAAQSDNPKIRGAGEQIRSANASQGLGFAAVNGERHLVHWQTIHLPDGPALVVGFILPESRFARTAIDTLRNVGLLALVFVTLGALLSLLAANGLVRPLGSLSQWAQQLAADHWHPAPPLSSPILEISSLAQTVNDMASRLQRHASELEQQVAERTAALEAANRQLATLSETDGLTGIANRRRFDEFAGTEWARATRNGHELTLMMLDVDLFKPYNDLYGHPAGDDALKRVAAELAKLTRRPGELVARYGGEEFAIVAAHTGEDVALKMAESVRAAVESLAIPHAQSPLGVVTVSIGVSVMRVTQLCTMQRWIAQADEALYRAKAKGRNRIESGQDLPA